MADLVAGFYPDLRDASAVRGRNFHGRLIAFERDQGGFRLEKLARLYMHLDDDDIFKVTDVGSLKDQLADICQNIGQPPRETSRKGTVDYAMIVGKAQG